MTSRRTFLRVLAAAAVGVAIAPSLPIPIPESPPPWWRNQAFNGESRPLTAEMMRETYEKYSRGPHHGSPQYLFTSRAVAERYQSLARKCGLVFDLEMAA